MSITPEEVQRIAREAAREGGKEGAKQALQEFLGIRLDSPDAIEKAQETWHWATRQRRMQAELSKNIRTATVWVVIPMIMAALGYGLIHLATQAGNGVEHAKEAGAAVLRSLHPGRWV
jgi:hypothetical protein